MEKALPCQVQCDALTASNLLLLNAATNICLIDALSDDVLLRIFDEFGKERPREVRCTVPLVCKRWRDALYSAKGDVKQFGHTAQHEEEGNKDLVLVLTAQICVYTAVFSWTTMWSFPLPSNRTASAWSAWGKSTGFGEVNSHSPEVLWEHGSTET